MLEFGSPYNRGILVGAGRRRARKASFAASLRELEAVAARLSIPVRYEKGEMQGGLCRLKHSWQIIINGDLADEEKAEILAHSLAQTNFDAVYVPPRVRQLLENARTTAP